MSRLCENENILTPDMPLDRLSGVGDARLKKLSKLYIHTLSELASYYPRAYEYRGEISKACDAACGKRQSFILEVCGKFINEKKYSSKTKRMYEIQKFSACDDSGSILIVFFGRPFLKDTFIEGRKFRFFGEVSSNMILPMLSSPAFEPADGNTPLCDYVPVYSLTTGITPKILSSFISQTLVIYKDNKYDTLESDIKEKYGLCDLYTALCGIHKPRNEEVLRAAKRRLAFEELYEFQKKMLGLSKRNSEIIARRLFFPDMKEFIEAIPFTLTNSQKYAIFDLLVDMTGERAPNKEPPKKTIYAARRLVQGDVGSGKTMVAAAGIFAAAKNKLQSALMAPTSILAKQHFDTLSPLFEKLGIKSVLLLGSMKKSEREQVYKALKNGEADVVIGTHAIIQDSVEFKNLSLVITDEQHRFGVNQRNRLQNSATSESGELRPHMLAMSATPIPRTLSMVLYGDMDVSIISELPPGRIPITTAVRGEEQRTAIYEFIRSQLMLKRQAYVVCPLIENEYKEDEYIPYIVNGADKEQKAVREYAEKLQNDIFPEFSVAYIHGKQKQAEKDAVMADFISGKINILVSTTVIEVGVNVPNATVMLIENAESFGLSQLHQLRGRVGRGNDKSYCILISPKYNKGNKNSIFSRRMEIISESESGFYIAEKDLELRGPGEYFGKRQHGELEFKIADLAADMDLIKETRALALEKFARANGTFS